MYPHAFWCLDTGRSSLRFLSVYGSSQCLQASQCLHASSLLASFFLCLPIVSTPLGVCMYTTQRLHPLYCCLLFSLLLMSSRLLVPLHLSCLRTYCLVTWCLHPYFAWYDYRMYCMYKSRIRHQSNSGLQIIVEIQLILFSVPPETDTKTNLQTPDIMPPSPRYEHRLRSP